MDYRWSQEWRNRYDTQARQLWQDMEQRVWRDARIFSGLEPSLSVFETNDDVDVLTQEELEDIGDLGGDENPSPIPTQESLFGRLKKSMNRCRANNPSDPRE